MSTNPAPKIVANRNLPLPRLEMRWKIVGPEERHCVYDLVMPADKYDLRNVHEFKKDGYFRVHVRTCKQSGSPVGPGTNWPDWPVEPDGGIRLPFRDAAHIAWDSFVLKIPAFIVHGRKAMVIEPIDVKAK